MMQMSYLEKKDVFDLIISTLQEHEKVLDRIASRLDARLNGEPMEPRKTPISNGESLENWR